MGLLDSIKGMFGNGKAAADVNNDGKITASDAQAAAQNAPQAISGAADVNNDGRVNGADATAAINKVKDQLPQ